MVTSKRMKGFSQTRKLLYIASEYAYALGVFASAVLGVATGADLDSNWLSNRPIVSRVVEVAQDYAIPVYIIICAVIVTSFLYRRKGDPWIWEKLKFILDEYQGKAFIKEAGDPSDHHRITLFKHEKNCLFVKHWSSTKTLETLGKEPHPFKLPSTSSSLRPFISKSEQNSTYQTTATIARALQPKHGQVTKQ
ncbi:hypothetical protein P4114_16125 [Pseudomonas aeruginosa]|nr:hypothetical protein [Pseudomonas aeruginosa]